MELLQFPILDVTAGMNANSISAYMISSRTSRLTGTSVNRERTVTTIILATNTAAIVTPNQKNDGRLTIFLPSGATRTSKKSNSETGSHLTSRTPEAWRISQ